MSIWQQIIFKIYIYISFRCKLMGDAKALILSAHVTQWLLFILGKIVWNFFLLNFNGLFCLNFSFHFNRFSKSFLEFFKKIETHHILTQVSVLLQFFTGFLHFGQMVSFFTNKFIWKKFQPEKYDFESCTRIFAWRKWPKFPRFWRKKISSLHRLWMRW